MMGIWRRLAGEVFLDWLRPPSGLKWIDIGCGNGASTAMIVDRCAPSEIQGIDPSEGQLAEFRQGEGPALPFSDGSFDIAVMALVIFFLPDPSQGRRRNGACRPRRRDHRDIYMGHARWRFYTGTHLRRAAGK